MFLSLAGMDLNRSQQGDLSPTTKTVFLYEIFFLFINENYVYIIPRTISELRNKTWKR